MLGELEVRPAETVLMLHGELDLATVAEVRQLLDRAAAAPGRRLVIDLNDVPFVDVLCLSAILATVDQARDSGRQAFVAGAASPVRKLCALLGADDALIVELPGPRHAPL